MGQEISKSQFCEADFIEFRQRLQHETQMLLQWHRENRFCAGPLTGGLELEAWLVDQNADPSPLNQHFLKLADHPLLSAELAQYNVELNTSPHRLTGDALSRFETDLNQHWTYCQSIARKLDNKLLAIGTLPTLRENQLTLQYMSPSQRYQALNEQIFEQRRGQPIRLNITGRESLRSEHQDVMLESATTSLQIHLKVPPEQAVRYYNAAIILSAPMVAVSANSPLLFGRDLWCETRIPLFEQAVESGGYFAAAGGPLHRVSFGSGYARKSLVECFLENEQHFPVLLPILFNPDENRAPHLQLHNGTIWRWNRPLIGYDDDGRPHIRIEHRVIPAGPSMTDNIANMALFFGLAYHYANLKEPPEYQLEFAQSRDNFYNAARQGLEQNIQWLDNRRLSIRDLLLDRLLPEAELGLKALSFDERDISHYLGIIAARIESGQTGCQWQRNFIAQHGRDMNALTHQYLHNQFSGRPVHTWD